MFEMGIRYVDFFRLVVCIDCTAVKRIVSCEIGIDNISFFSVPFDSTTVTGSFIVNVISFENRIDDCTRNTFIINKDSSTAYTSSVVDECVVYNCNFMCFNPSKGSTTFCSIVSNENVICSRTLSSTGFSA